jgi:histidine triad (HIT) family protein
MQREADADFRREKLTLSEDEFKEIAAKIQAAFK